MSLRLVPITLRAANAYVSEHHRHHKPARGCLFCVSVRDGDRIAGIAIIGRPVSRLLDDGRTAEVIRCCTDGTANACSMLYGAARRAARAIGYLRVVTYTLPEEGGASLRAAGWRFDGEAGGGSWSRECRRRQDNHPLTRKWRWVAQTGVLA